MEHFTCLIELESRPYDLPPTLSINHILYFIRNIARGGHQFMEVHELRISAKHQ